MERTDNNTRAILLIFSIGDGTVMTAWWEERAKEKQEKFQKVISERDNRLHN